MCLPKFECDMGGSKYITILSHQRGKDLSVAGPIQISDSTPNRVIKMASHNEHIVITDKDDGASVWNYEMKAMVHKFDDISNPSKVAMNDRYIAIKTTLSGIQV